jgi:hypothetical protein
MSIKMTLNKDEFRSHMNQIRPDNFSYDGLGALFDYFDSMDPEQIEYDPIGICCDFSQCSLKEFKDAYTDVAITSEMTEDEKRQAIAEFIGMYGFWFAFVEDGKEVIFENF